MGRLQTMSCTVRRVFTLPEIRKAPRSLQRRQNGFRSGGVKLQDTPVTTTRHFTTSDDSPPVYSRPKNDALEQIKAAGMIKLETTTTEVIAKTKKPLFEEENDAPTPKQLSEGRRIFEELTDVLEKFSRKDNTFCIKGEPIVISEVEISRDLKQAKIYWTLPYGLIGLPDAVADKITSRMQNILIKRGSKLQVLVHTRLRHYFPPKLYFVPAKDNLMRHALKDMLNI